METFSKLVSNVFLLLTLWPDDKYWLNAFVHAIKQFTGIIKRPGFGCSVCK